jgi:hypothetical protein
VGYEAQLVGNKIRTKSLLEYLQRRYNLGGLSIKYVNIILKWILINGV